MVLFEWDEANVEHIARHGVTPAECEEVLAGAYFDLGADEEKGEIRFPYLGETARGRILLVVVTERGEALRPVTAFEPGTYLRKLYLQSRLTL